MESFEDLVDLEVKQKEFHFEETARRASLENNVNIAVIIGVAKGNEGDIFSDPDTPQEATLLNDIKALLDNYVKLTQQLVTDIENNVNDIFTP